MRPVCAASATSSINGPLSNIISMILNGLADEMDEKVKSECKSTEEMVAAIENANSKNRLETVVWSSDVKALYPSLKIKEVTEVVYSEFLTSDMNIEVDLNELGLYLALILNKEEIQAYGIETFVAKWKKEGKGGRKPGITTAEVRNEKRMTEEKSKFYQPTEIPNDEQKRKMIAIALKYGVKTVMENHVYKFNGDLFLQNDGGPIGLELTGAVARIFMLHWDRKLIQKINNATNELDWELYMYLRYVDDSNFIGRVMPPGARVEGEKIVIKQHCIHEDKNIRPDIHTAKVIQELANQICESIQVTIDCPSLHENKKMPILDLEVQMIENMVEYTHFKKSMVNDTLLMKQSAMPYKMKKASLIQEGVRILRNTSRRLGSNEQVRHLNEFSWRLKISGYEDYERREIIMLATKAYEKQVRKDEQQITPLYRPKGYMKDERKIMKASKKTTWYKPYDTVLYVPVTPKSELKREIQKVVEKHCDTGMRIKVVEKAGKRLGKVLPGLKQKTECGREDCMLHTSGNIGDCGREGIVYRGECLDCAGEGREKVYIGETGRSMYVRGKQHLEAINNPTRHKSNAFARHIIKEHKGKKCNIGVKIVASFTRPLDRQVREGVEIMGVDDKNLLNSKLDHYKPVGTRVTFNNILEILENENENNE